jgi:thymidylate kinase
LFFFQYQWQRIHHRYPNVKMIQLQPSLDACLERNRTRMHKAEIIPDEEVRQLYEITRGGTWEIVDANPSIERVAAEIYRKVVDGAR